jgi:hypothetical protein
LNSSSGIEELLNILNKCNTARLSNGSSAIEEKNASSKTAT